MEGRNGGRKFHQSKIAIIFAYLISFVGLLIFAKGFFPMKAARRGKSSLENVPSPPLNQDLLIQLIKDDFVTQKHLVKEKQVVRIAKPYTKLVLLVIDAMRIDFIQSPTYNKHMPFLNSLLEQNVGQIYTSKAKAPTVTMPRIKAMTTGSIPGYIDVILNMDQSLELKEDNIVQGLESEGKKIVFFGDDTWMRLFPKSFVRTDGTTSFFVTDYTEVDNNVTRHLDEELYTKNDWDVMILHYLGLDHIGHIAGPTSPLVGPKLTEMDDAIKKVYTALQNKKDSLMIITSDHGMSARGSHGGTTEPEVDTPLVFLNPSLKNFQTNPKHVEQIDLAPTLSLLFGIPIPQGSMGKVIPNMLTAMNQSSTLHALQYNCHQLLNHLSQAGRLVNNFIEAKNDPLHLYRNGVQFHGKFLEGNKNDSYTAAYDNYVKCHTMASDSLTSNIASYNYPEMASGIVVLCAGFCLVLYLWVEGLLQSKRSTITLPQSKSFSRAVIALTVGTIVHVATLPSSSFVEEEHQIWHFLTASLAMSLFVAILRATAEAASVDKATDKSVSLYDAHVHVSSQLRLRKGHQTWQVVYNDTKPQETVDNGTIPLIEEEKIEVAEENEDETHIKDHPIVTYKHWKVLFIAFGFVFFHRVLRAWNQTGIQYADQPDLGDWLNLPQHKIILSFASAASLLCILFSSEMICNTRDIARTAVCAAGLTTVYLYRHATDTVAFFTVYGSHNQSIGLSEARLVYGLCAFLLFKALLHRISEHCCHRVQPKKGHMCSAPSLYCSPTPVSRQQALDCMQTIVVLLAALLLRPHNHCVLAFNLILYWSLFRVLWPVVVEGNLKLMDLSMLELRSLKHSGFVSTSEAVVRITLACWFGQMAYFTMGNSNSFATVDLSAGFVGLSGSEGVLNSSLTVLLGSFTTYIGPILWTTFCVCDLIKLCLQATDVTETPLTRPQSSTANLVACTFITLRLLQVIVYVMVATGHRYHLFVWSVFSPKLLYELVNTWVHGWLLALTLLLW
uniref:GPI ethanolamine phosphate transferase 2-like n=1 Tax=Phallusia mammillata TaxID=59560 RepID=A0A6F9DN34_9ASCI|nr:GPI ethanolamine phosphate transferase 2-like [Phallusia mammillata]